MPDLQGIVLFKKTSFWSALKNKAELPCHRKVRCRQKKGDLSKMNSNNRKKMTFFNLDLYKSAYQVAIGSLVARSRFQGGARSLPDQFTNATEV